MKPLDALLSEHGARIVVRPMDVAIPYEKSFIIESTVKVRHPDRTWPNSGLSPMQREHRGHTEQFIDKQRTLVATFVRPTQAPLTSVVLGFVTYATDDDVVTMLYVKRDFRGYGIGAKLLGGTGVAGDIKVIQAEPWRPNECWARWVMYHERHVVTGRSVPMVGHVVVDEDLLVERQAAMVARSKVRQARGGRHGR